MKLERLSIKWKVFLYLIGFCLLLLLMLWLFQIVLLDSFYKRIKTNEIQAISRSVVSHIAQGDWEKLSNAVTGHGDLTVEIWEDGYGTVLLAGKLLDGLQLNLSYNDKQSLLALTKENGGKVVQGFMGGSGFFPHQREREGLLYASVYLNPNTGKEQLLLISAAISPVDATVQTLRVLLYVISGIMVVLSVALAFLIAKRVSRPIESLNQSAAELAKGHYDVGFQSGGYREISELSDTLNHAAKELAKTEHLRRELIANVSHDLRTPLTLITGYGEMIRDLPGENTPENMQVIIDESKRLTSLVNDMMDLSKMQAGVVEMQLEPYPLTRQTQEIVQRIAEFFRKEGYQIFFLFSEEIWVEADSQGMEQVVYNLLINAVTHTGPDKRVDVVQKRENDRVILEIQDTGEGIAQEDLPFIWDRYYKADKAHKRTSTGTGLGLSIVRWVLEQHSKAVFGVRSQIGEGSTFWFSFPILPG